MIVKYLGKLPEEMTREELVTAFLDVARELNDLRREQRLLAPFINWKAYLCTPKSK